MTITFDLYGRDLWIFLTRWMAMVRELYVLNGIAMPHGILYLIFGTST